MDKIIKTNNIETPKIQKTKITNNIETRKEIKWTMWKYLVSNLGRAQWPLWVLNSKIDKNWNKRIKLKKWHPEIDIINEDGKRSCKLVYRLVAQIFSNQIENNDIKSNFKHPILIHKDWNKLNNLPSNLMRVNQKPPLRWKYMYWSIKWKKEQIAVKWLLINNSLLSNQNIAKYAFWKNYDPKIHNGFVSRERRKLENDDIIDLSKIKKNKKIINDNINDINTLIKDWKTAKEIAEKFWVTKRMINEIIKK